MYIYFLMGYVYFRTTVRLNAKVKKDFPEIFPAATTL